MKILGIESSCDECAASVVEDGRRILSNIVATQIRQHAEFNGVVPEIASRLHTEWIYGVVHRALSEAGLAPHELDGIAVTNTPGLAGSLIVGMAFAKALAWSLGKPFIGVNHILAHLYAPFLAEDIAYPFIGLMVSGGHTLLCKVHDFDDAEVLGASVDDAVGEAFDKVAKHYGFGYPGGIAIDKLARKGNAAACSFPLPKIEKGARPYDVSYSGLKTAAVYQLDKLWNPAYARTPENIAAAFEKAAVDILLSRLYRLVDDTGIRRVVAGGGVAANTYLRAALAARQDITALFPPLDICGDNAAMVAGLAYKFFSRGYRDDYTLNVFPRYMMQDGKLR